MSNEPHHEPSSGGAAFFATLIGCALFLGVLWFAYFKQRPAPLGDGVRTSAQREATLKKLHDKESADATTYGWVDKDKKIVRLPLDRAIELTIQDLNAGPAKK